MPEDVSLVTHAMSYARKGYHIFPVARAEKRPLTPRGHLDATTDRKQVWKWWIDEFPDANIGIALSPSGLLVIDVDGEGGRMEVDMAGVEGPVVQTASGIHIWTARPSDCPTARAIHTGASRQIDLLSDGFIIAPPSLHPTGVFYQWRAGGIPERSELPEAPIWAVETMKERVQAREAVGGEYADVQAWAEPLPVRLDKEGLDWWEGRKFVPAAKKPGGVDRSETLYVLAKQFAYYDLPPETIAALLAEADQRLGYGWMKGRRDASIRFLETARRAIQVAESEPRFAKARLTLARVKKVSDLMAQDFPELRWVVAGVLPEGAHLLAAPPKTGKTWLALSIAVDVARGTAALGVQGTAQGPVLYLALEDGQRRLQKRLRSLLDGATAPSHMDYDTDWPKADQGGVEAIKDWLDANHGASLVVVDTLKRFRPSRQAKGDVYSEDYEALAPLNDLAHEYGVCILVIHHTRKADAEDPLDRISGTTGLTGAVDGALVLKRARGEKEATLWVVNRDAEDQQLALLLDGSTQRYSLVGTAQERDMSAARKEIVMVLRSTGRPMKPTEAAEALGKPANNVKQLMWTMAMDSQLIQFGDGTYRLPPEK